MQTLTWCLSVTYVAGLFDPKHACFLVVYRKQVLQFGFFGQVAKCLKPACFGGNRSSVSWRRSLYRFSRRVLGCWVTFACVCSSLPKQTLQSWKSPVFLHSTFGVRNGVTELAVGKECGLSPGSSWLNSSVWGKKSMNRIQGWILWLILHFPWAGENTWNS